MYTQLLLTQPISSNTLTKPVSFDSPWLEYFTDSLLAQRTHLAGSATFCNRYERYFNEVFPHFLTFQIIVQGDWNININWMFNCNLRAHSSESTWSAPHFFVLRLLIIWQEGALTQKCPSFQSYIHCYFKILIWAAPIGAPLRSPKVMQRLALLSLHKFKNSITCG